MTNQIRMMNDEPPPIRPDDRPQNDAIDSAENSFDEEVAQTCRNAKLMALLNERSKQTATIPLDEVKRQLGLSS